MSDKFGCFDKAHTPSLYDINSFRVCFLSYFVNLSYIIIKKKNTMHFCAINLRFCKIAK